MGRGIDRLVLKSLLAGALYVFFIGAMGNIPLAAAAAFTAMAIIKKLSEKLPCDKLGRKRRDMKNARSELERLALSHRDDAQHRISQLIREEFPGMPENTRIKLLPGHPAGRRLSADDIAEAWKDIRNCERAVIVSTAAADESAFTLAARLTSPRTELIDAPQLAALIAHTHPSAETSAPVRKQRAGRFAAVARAAGRAKAGKCVLTGITMFLIYCVSGITVHLVGALILIFIAGVSLKRRRLPRELFAD